MKRLGMTLGAAAALLLSPPAAQAATVEVTSASSGEGVLSYAGEPGEANDVKLVWEFDAYEFEVRDAGAVVTAGAGCFTVDDHTARCDGGGITRVEADGGDGDDVLDDDVPPVPGSGVHHVAVAGGEGDDQLLGSRVQEGFDGGPGADYVSGGKGVDTVTVDGGGTGAGVSVTLDARANDGLPDEGDNIRGNVEYVIGGPGPDVLIGNNGEHHLYGAGGDDRIAGRGGDDDLAGGNGIDRLEGGAGHDRLDAVDPGGATADTAMCGDAWDSAIGDPLDGLATDCEEYLVDGTRRFNAPTKASGRPPGLPAIVAPTVLVRSRTLVAIVGCRREAACHGTIRVYSAVRSARGASTRRTLARGTFKGRPRRMRLVKLKLSGRARRVARRARRGTAVLNARGARGGTRVTRRRVRLR